MKPMHTRSVNRHLVRVLTIFGLAATVIAFILIKQHPAFFALDGDFYLLLKNLGFLGPLLLILLQIIQVVYPIIPGGLTLLVGHVLFGPLLGFIYTQVSLQALSSPFS